MQTIQIQEFKSVSDQKIYLENIEDLEQNLNETLKLSNQTSIKQAIKKTKILFDQTQNLINSVPLRERYEYFKKLSLIWLEQLNYYRNDSEAVGLMKPIVILTNSFTAYRELFRGYLLINEERTENRTENLGRIALGISVIAECIDVFSAYFTISELKQIYDYSKNALSSSIPDTDKYFEKDIEISILETKIRAYHSLILLKLKKYFGDSYQTSITKSKISTFVMWDFLIKNNQDQPILGVEVKTKMNTSSDWVIKFRHNILMDSYVQKIPFFLMAFPDRFYLWTEPGIYSNQSEPTYIIDALPVLKPYFERAGIMPEKIRGDSFELLVGSWLSDMINSEQLPEEFNESQYWLIDSGLYVAISGGDLKYGATE